MLKATWRRKRGCSKPYVSRAQIYENKSCRSASSSCGLSGWNSWAWREANRLELKVLGVGIASIVSMLVLVLSAFDSAKIYVGRGICTAIRETDRLQI
ncbi:hypothetical protein EJ02DRAFT_239709 [Clathrospora elynae]|uniref:Uncharacterized protein n=1 Tax=Clathrospora elynae TaxID=706981 RepID=A0A6A5SKF8_9PLEO|nr:hypothetical protein EJ02DRAFT_239709 [Clathrospora elynae]